MSFETAEKITAVCQILKNPPIILLGSNQIGKSSCLQASAKQFPNSDFIIDLDRGGYLKEEKKPEFKAKENIVLSGIENTLRRKYEIARSTLVIISSSIDDATGRRLIFEDKGLPDSSKKRNWIIGMTFQHFLKLYSEWKEYDLLSRFAILHVDRQITPEEAKRDGYKPYFTIAQLNGKAEEIPILESVELYSDNPRQHRAVNNIRSGLVAFGHITPVTINFVNIDREGIASVKQIKIADFNNAIIEPATEKTPHSPTYTHIHTSRGMEPEKSTISEKTTCIESEKEREIRTLLGLTHVSLGKKGVINST